MTGPARSGRPDAVPAGRGDLLLPQLVLDRGSAGVRPHRTALPVAQVRRLEAALMAELAEGTLMQRAAAALAVECARVLRETAGGVTGRRAVLLVGGGDNGGDALYAGARLARRGVAVTALLVAPRHHEAGATALRAAGGVLRQVDPAPAGLAVDAGGSSWRGRYPLEAERALLGRADLVLDGVLGIGGHGGLRGAAAVLAYDAAASGAVVAVDLPSGIDADTGAVPGVAVRAHRTVTMGVLKPGLLVGAGRAYAGRVTVVDIGLPLDQAHPVRGEGTSELALVDDEEAMRWLARPEPGDDKYRRGVVGIAAGSARYPGAAVLCAGAARHGDAGYVRYAGAAAAEVVRRWPDVVATTGSLTEAGRVQCWVVGPGRGTDDDAARTVLAALEQDVPVVLDADALTVVAQRREVREAVTNRRWPTVLTPHAGEFGRLGGGDVSADRVGAVRALADELAAIVLLKGATTLVGAGGSPRVHVVASGPPELATAGTGDVLSGLLGSVLAHEGAGLGGLLAVDPQGAVTAGGAGSAVEAARASTAAAVAAAAHVHGVAGQLAAAGGRSVAALDVLAALPEAVAAVRRSAD